MIWPLPIAPYAVQIVQMKAGAEEQDALALEIHDALEAQGMDVLWDERPKLSPGLKFKDADLVGIPLRIVVGRDAWERKVEFGTRDSGERETIAVEDALGKVVSLWKEACA
jgi:prolyl-tRNA synthetase